MKTNFSHLLLGSDLRKLKNIRKVQNAVYDQQSFDELFSLIFHHKRPLVMRAADVVEKISRVHPEYLEKHKEQILAVMKSADHKELKWHVAQLVARVDLTTDELADVWHALTYWALNPNESKIVRVNALQGLFDLSRNYVELKSEFLNILHVMEHELIPSIQARIRKIKKFSVKIAD